VGAFDEAFKSRIHISLFYPWLNVWQTTRIWDMQMRRIKERLKTIEIDTQQILEYAKLHFETQCRLTGGTGWNGRQIRNAFQSATALAQFECKSPSDPVHLQVRHFEIVAKAAAEFDDYLIRTTGHSDAERAAFNMMRTDSFNPSTSNPMSLESMMQARGYAGAATAHMTSFGGGMGSQMPAQAAFGGTMRSNFATGLQGMQSMNQGNFGMGMGQGMPFQQAGYGMAGPSAAQAAFMGGTQVGNPQQMWPMQNPAPSGMTGIQQGSMGLMPEPVQQLSGQTQDTTVGQQASVQPPGQSQHQGGNMQAPQGFTAAAGFQQYPQQGQGY
jgi:hypothetical protein